MPREDRPVWGDLGGGIEVRAEDGERRVCIEGGRPETGEVFQAGDDPLGVVGGDHVASVLDHRLRVGAERATLSRERTLGPCAQVDDRSKIAIDPQGGDLPGLPTSGLPSPLRRPRREDGRRRETGFEAALGSQARNRPSLLVDQDHEVLSESAAEVAAQRTELGRRGDIPLGRPARLHLVGAIAHRGAVPGHVDVEEHDAPDSGRGTDVEIRLEARITGGGAPHPDRKQGATANKGIEGQHDFEGDITSAEGKTGAGWRPARSPPTLGATLSGMESPLRRATAVTDDKLRRYREKRDAGQTPEPFGGSPAAPGSRMFVVQMHAARNLHWDLRLEMEGALESWAVPKGPSPNPADKRLAMHVEPHPLEYADFEGVIPDGQYGAGPSICWDRGVWIEIPEKPGGPKHGIEHGKLLFELRGFKLKGLWTLVHTPRNGDNHWLLIKERDALVDERGTELYPRDSILSGLTVEELADPAGKQTRVAAEAKAAGAREAVVSAEGLDLMLATALDEPFSKDGWVFEIKYDGYRIAAARSDTDARLWSRNGNDLTDTFPEIARAVRGLPFPGMILDGEVVVHDATGMPSFALLQKRGRLTRRADVAAAAVQLPATYYAFDLLAFGGLDLRELPLVDRKRLLRSVLPTVGPVRYSEHIDRDGIAVFDHAARLGIEGVVAKRAAAPYASGRSADWLKIRTIRTDDFVVVGWTDPKGTRRGFGALHLGCWTSPPADDPGARLLYAGSVGTGFSASDLDDFGKALEPLARPEPAAVGDGVPEGPGHHWVEPRLVVEVRYKELTPAGHLRHPSFLARRLDKDPTECVWPDGGAGAPRSADPDRDAEALLPAPGPVTGAVPSGVAVTNVDKILYPEREITKGMVLDYYDAIAPWMLPYLEERCLVLTRYPDGIHSSSFYQKNAPDWAPDWIRTETVYSEGSARDLEYFVIDDAMGLKYVANSAALLLHIWGARVGSLSHPDWCILDLDPKEAPFAHVVDLALAIKEIADDIGLPLYVKTSGSSGLHLLVPLGRRLTHEQTKQLGQLLAAVAVQERGDIATIDRVIERRDGKVYVDFLQNGWGKLLVAPFSTRPVPEAAVSMPLEWSEVDSSLGPRDFTITNAVARMEELGRDPLRPILDEAPDLLGALERLLARV